MSQDLVIHLRDGEAFAWSILTRETGERRASGQAELGALPNLPDLGEIDRTLLLLPAERVFATQIALAARSDREARQAAPFMIEDELASRLEATRIVSGARDENGKRWIFAIDEDWFDHRLKQIEPLLSKPVNILPDAMAIAEPDAALTLYDRAGSVLFWYGAEVRIPGQAAGGAAEARLFEQVAAALVAGANGGEVRVAPSLGLAGPGLNAYSPQPLDVCASKLEDSQLGLLPAMAGEKWLSSLDWTGLLLPLRRAAALAAAAVIIFAALLIGESVYYRYQADRFEQASIDVYREVNPSFTRATIPAEVERLLRQDLARLGGGADTSSFLSLAAALVSLTEDNERVRIEHLRFDQSRGELRVSAIYTDFADFDALSAAAERLGVQLQDEGAREGDAGLQGEFLLRVQ